MTRIFLLSVFLVVFLIGSSEAQAGDVALPGHHPLSQAEAGSVLISELRCAACHSGIKRSTVPEKMAPDLARAGARISPDFLKRFLASPVAVHPGTTMPDVLGSRPESDRKEIAEALTHFLVAQSTAVWHTEAGESAAESEQQADRQKGRELFHSVGCIACHGPADAQAVAPLNSANSGSRENVDQQEKEEEPGDEDPLLVSRKSVRPVAVPLGHVKSKYSVKSLSEFLFQPLEVRASGRMPDMKLTPAESLSIANYLIGEATQSIDALNPDALLVEQGRKHFQDLRCASCHAMPGIVTAPLTGPLNTENLSQGCLSEPTTARSGIRSPMFDLNAAQVAAIGASIREAAAPAGSESGSVLQSSDSVALAMMLTAFRCTTCHVRDDYGGVHDEHNPFFTGSELKLGDDGRIPPPLTLMGAKLQPNWLKKVLFDGESVRHYMVTRMPQYGSQNLSELPALFHRLDNLTGPKMELPSPESRSESEREREKLIRAAGRELLGDKGANCVSCHTFNGKAAQLNQGIDLLTSFERLQPEWFSRYLQNPGSFRPRTVMPTAWPGGRAVFTKVLEGDTDRQIEAIWYYLSLGTSAADPSGVRSVSTKLEVGDHAVIHRGRSRVAGFRGIAVGFPEKISYAFNAETGTLSAIWQGNFINVNWGGQGSGDFHPAGEPIQLAQDVSFAMLADGDAPWPLLPVMTKESRVNPNPLYPKNVGYQFRGYYLDDRMIPTFQYRCGTILIEDRLMAIDDNEHRRLHRVLRFESPAPQTVWFRALVGEISRETDQLFRTERLRLVVPPIEAKVRQLSGDPKQSELLLQLKIPQGKSSLEFLYEPLSN